MHRHNLHVYVALAAILPFLYLGARIAHSYHVAGFALLITVLIVEVYVVLRVIPRADTNYCVRLGFVCPFCNQPLYKASDIVTSSPLITRGECPHCGKSLIPSPEK